MAYTQGHSTQDYLRMVGEMVAHHKKRTYDLMQIQPGHKVLDVGCGPATDTIALANLVGETGQVIGIDHAQAQIDLANEKARNATVTERVTHKLDNAMALSFDSNYFDSSRSERVFQHLVNPQQALSEMIRVTKPGGWIVVLDTDWSTGSTDTDEVDIERRLLNFHIDYGFANGLVGRQLFRMFRQQNLADIHVEMAPIHITSYAISRKGGMLDEAEQAALQAGVVTEQELDRFRRSLEKADQEGTYFTSITQTLIAGRKPE